MIPNKTIEELISRHSSLEKDLSAGTIDKKLFAEKSKEYSDVNEIIENYLGGRKAKARSRDAEIRARRLITSNETR